jgi:hypothetical protein
MQGHLKININLFSALCPPQLHKEYFLPRTSINTVYTGTRGIKLVTTISNGCTVVCLFFVTAGIPSWLCIRVVHERICFYLIRLDILHLWRVRCSGLFHTTLSSRNVKCRQKSFLVFRIFARLKSTMTVVETKNGLESENLFFCILLSNFHQNFAKQKCSPTTWMWYPTILAKSWHGVRRFFACTYYRW